TAPTSSGSSGASGPTRSSSARRSGWSRSAPRSEPGGPSAAASAAPRLYVSRGAARFEKGGVEPVKSGRWRGGGLGSRRADVEGDAGLPGGRQREGAVRPASPRGEG